MWLWSEQIDEKFTQNLGHIQCAKVPECCLETKAFFPVLLGAIVSQNLPLQSKPFPPTLKDRDNNRPQSSYCYWSDSSRFILPFNQARSQVFSFGGEKYIFGGERFLFLLYL